MTVGQQIIINIVMDNPRIYVFEREDIFNYKYFGTDYKYLDFVLNTFYKNNVVTLGELLTKFPDFPAGDLKEVSQDMDFLVYQIKEGYVYSQLSQAIAEGQSKFPNDGIQLLGYLEDKIDILRNLIPTHADYDALEHAKERQEKSLRLRTTRMLLYRQVSKKSMQ